MQQGQGRASRMAVAKRLFKHRVTRQVAVREMQSLTWLQRLQGFEAALSLMPGTGTLMAWP